MPEPRKLRVFLCHASQDKPVVREIYQRLLAEGWIDPWLDEEKLLPGQDWDLEIGKAVENADAVIVCLSNGSVAKDGYIQKEIRMVLDVSERKPEGSIFLIPLRLEECDIPRRLTKWHWGNYFSNEPNGKEFELLLSSLKQQANYLGKNYYYLNSTKIDSKSKVELSLKRIKSKDVAKIGRYIMVETTYEIEQDKFLDEKPLRSLIISGENSDLEFMSVLPVDRESEQLLVRTLAGLMNYNGGIVLIGVEDSGEVVGLDKVVDFEESRRHLRSLIAKLLDKTSSEAVQIDFVNYRRKVICGIKVFKSQKPTFLRIGEFFEFPVRFGNTTVLLDVKDTVLYVEGHWHS